jgi:predicted house-cleaning noncanonical NTP pyrophosphatase (MazG superfamily)
LKKNIYNKLVRDKIPEIIKNNNKKCNFYIADKSELEQFLLKKLSEETNEFIESRNLEEIADILEVISAILDFKGINFEKIEKIRKAKSESRGAFKKGLILIDVDS